MREARSSRRRRRRRHLRRRPALSARRRDEAHRRAGRRRRRRDRLALHARRRRPPFPPAASSSRAPRVALSTACASSASSQGIHTFTCGFRAWRKDAFLGCLPREDGFAATAEMLLRALRSRRRVVEVPSTLRARARPASPRCASGRRRYGTSAFFCGAISGLSRKFAALRSAGDSRDAATHARPCASTLVAHRPSGRLRKGRAPLRGRPGLSARGGYAAIGRAPGTAGREVENLRLRPLAQGVTFSVNG